MEQQPKSIRVVEDRYRNVGWYVGSFSYISNDFFLEFRGVYVAINYILYISSKENPSFTLLDTI